MLACDLIMEVRASRSVSTEQAARVERIVFGSGEPDSEGLELIFAIDRYAERTDPRWDDLVARAMPGTAYRAPISDRQGRLT